VVECPRVLLACCRLFRMFAPRGPRFGVILLGRNDAVEPFSNRHSGTARCLTRRFLRLATTSSQLPRITRLHNRIRVGGTSRSAARASTVESPLHRVRAGACTLSFCLLR